VRAHFVPRGTKLAGDAGGWVESNVGLKRPPRFNNLLKAKESNVKG
jgi:hypothetical protein